MVKSILHQYDLLHAPIYRLPMVYVRKTMQRYGMGTFFNVSRYYCAYQHKTSLCLKHENVCQPQKQETLPGEF